MKLSIVFVLAAVIASVVGLLVPLPVESVPSSPSHISSPPSHPQVPQPPGPKSGQKRKRANTDDSDE